MAEVLATFPGGRSHNGQSKFSKILDGQIWSVTPAEFGCANMATLRSNAHSAARQMGKRLVTRSHDGSLVVQCVERGK